MQTVKEFLEAFICKAGESIRHIGEMEWEIQRWTARTYKTTGNVLAAEEYDISPNEEILKLELRPNARRSSLPISAEAKHEALQKGWLVQEIRFKQDGRTPSTTVYRMGPGLLHYRRLKEEEEKQADQELRQALFEELEKSMNILPQQFVYQTERFALGDDDEGWGKERVRKFIHFLIAFLQLKRQQTQMEYKEIGAAYYKKIGGSKVFDSYREFFIGRLERWIDAPVTELGIVSAGSIVPIVFSGNVRGRYSSYMVGTVHATTDIAVMEETFQTDATHLWLVENRAVLTRMAAEVEFLTRTSSLVIGVDGQLRGAHRKMIQQLCANSSMEEIVIWVDYDQAGMIIARDLFGLAGRIPVRFIGNEGNVFQSYEEYLQWTKTIQSAEQEMTLGGPAEWLKWINK